MTIQKFIDVYAGEMDVKLYNRLNDPLKLFRTRVRFSIAFLVSNAEWMPREHAWVWERFVKELKRLGYSVQVFDFTSVKVFTFDRRLKHEFKEHYKIMTYNKQREKS